MSAWASVQPTKRAKSPSARSLSRESGGMTREARDDGPREAVAAPPPRHSRESGNPGRERTGLWAYPPRPTASLGPTSQAPRPHGNRNRNTNMDSRFRGNDGGGGGPRDTGPGKAIGSRRIRQGFLHTLFRGNDEGGCRDGLPRAVVTGLFRHSPAFAGAGSARPGISRACSAEPTPTRAYRDFFTRSKAGIHFGRSLFAGGGSQTDSEGFIVFVHDLCLTFGSACVMFPKIEGCGRKPAAGPRRRAGRVRSERGDERIGPRIAHPPVSGAPIFRRGLPLLFACFRPAFGRFRPCFFPGFSS